MEVHNPNFYLKRWFQFLFTAVFLSFLAPVTIKTRFMRKVWIIFFSYVCVFVCAYVFHHKVLLLSKIISRTYFSVRVNDVTLWASAGIHPLISPISVSEFILFHLQRQYYGSPFNWKENDIWCVMLCKNEWINVYLILDISS